MLKSIIMVKFCDSRQYFHKPRQHKLPDLIQKVVGPVEVMRHFQLGFDGSRGELEMFYRKMGPDDFKDEAGKKTVCKRKAGSREKEQQGERKRGINERVCCDSCSNAAAIITIHQDNE